MVNKISKIVLKIQKRLVTCIHFAFAELRNIIESVRMKPEKKSKGKRFFSFSSHIFFDNNLTVL